MKLYFSPGACSMAPHMAMIELGIEHSLEQVNLRVHPHVLKDSGALYSTVNPKGSVPALKLPTGDILTENAAILQYLGDQKPDSNLLPPMGTMERYRVMEWLSFLGSDFHKTIGQFWNPNLPENAKELGRQNLDRRLKYLNQHFSTHSYLMGEKFCLADIYLWVMLNWMPTLKLDSSAYPNVEKFKNRVGERPAAAKVLKAEGLI